MQLDDLDDDEFTREPLYTTMPDAYDADQLAERPVDGEFEVSSGPPRQHIARRALLAVGVCALLAVTVLVGTGNAGYLWREARFAWLRHNAPTLARSALTSGQFGERSLAGWQRQPGLSLPRGDIHWYTPAPNDPLTFYSCSAAHITTSGSWEDGPLIFWYSHDAGEHWSSATIPQTSASSCYVSVATDAPQRLSLLSQHADAIPTQDTSCSPLTAFLSLDGGSHWHAVPSLPDAPMQADQNAHCNVSLWPSARHLYLLSQYATPTGPPNSSDWTFVTLLARSDDDGHTWKRLDGNLPPESDAGFSPTGLDDGETLLFHANHYDPPAQGKPSHIETWLWISHDAGDSWQPLGNIQGIGVQSILLPAEARSVTPSRAQPFYLISNTSIPSLGYRIQIAQVSDLHHWAPLPPLPIAGASPEHLGITSVLTETASGNLLVFGLGPGDRVPSDTEQQSASLRPAQQWLWEWNPQTSRWIVFTPALDVPWPRCSDHCWNGWLAPGAAVGDTDGAGAYLWVMGYEGVDDNGAAHAEVFRILLPGVEKG